MKKAWIVCVLFGWLGHAQAATATYFVRKVTHIIGSEVTATASGALVVEFEITPNAPVAAGAIWVQNQYPFALFPFYGSDRQIPYDFISRGSPYLRFLSDMESALILMQRVEVDLGTSTTIGAPCLPGLPCLVWAASPGNNVSYKVMP